MMAGFPERLSSNRMSIYREPKDISINGRFLTQKLSGVQRYSRELVTALDRLIQCEPLTLGRSRWRLLVPPGADPQFKLATIAVVVVGTGNGHMWEQRHLRRAAAGTRLLNLGNSGPVLHRDKLVVIHDAAVYRTPSNFGTSYRIMHRLLGHLLAHTGQIGTVSEFSRRELAQVFGLREEAIGVVPNGCDHFVGRAQDAAVLKELGVDPGRYFLFVGNPAPNNNLAVLLAAFARLDRPGAKLVIAGSLDRAVFGGSGAAVGANVVFAGGCSDAQVAALYANAKAHVFPSVYEGFGIPPLEAMASGCPVIASDIPVIREVCGDAVSYFAPHDVAALLSMLEHHWDSCSHRPEQKQAAAERLAQFTWHSSARRLIEAMCAP